jgi:hypothetical protein
MSGPTTPFTPLGSQVTNTPVLTTSVNSALGRTTGFGESLKIINGSGSAIGVRWGTGAQTAVTTDPTLAIGETRIFQVPSGVDNVATFARAAVTGTVDIQSGAGGI